MIAVKDYQLQEVDDNEVDYVLPSSSRAYGMTMNALPLSSAVAVPRMFYGDRFLSQALPLQNPQTPLVQNLDPEDEAGRSFDDLLGDYAGNLRSDYNGVVKRVKDDYVEITDEQGQNQKLPLYRNFSYNRKTGLHQTPLVKTGQVVKIGDLLARSNYTNDQGALALGVNAKIAMVPMKGFSMDDATVISESFAKSLTSEEFENVRLKIDGKEIKGGKNHFTGMFADRFSKEQLEKLSSDGVVEAGAILQPGDPIILATRPKAVSSNNADIGKLSRSMSSVRADISEVWDGNYPAEVISATKGKNGYKVRLRYYAPAKHGDKLTLRHGQKMSIAQILPDDQMPYDSSGERMDLLLNQLSIPSRVNDATPYELLLGKVAKKQGAPLKIPSYLAAGENWYDKVSQMLEENNLSPEDDLYDPLIGRNLDEPVTTGWGYVQKLVHTSKSKVSGRGQGSYTNDEQPAKGGGESAQAKRNSGLEVDSLMAAGAYATLRDSSTIGGQKNDAYWRAIRSGGEPPTPGAPFVWDKFKALVSGAGYALKNLPEGEIRLGPMTDRSLDEKDPLELSSGELIDLNDPQLTAYEGGLFDRRLVQNSRWGKITLDRPVPNPAYEEAIRSLLGLTKKQYRNILAGKEELPEPWASRINTKTQTK